jgi:fatty-acyl-CoA synthase
MKVKWSSFLAHNAREFANREALVEQATKTRLSYAELYDEVQRWASYLHTQGVRPKDCVTLLATNRREHLTVFLACAELGALFVPLNFRLSPSELQSIVERVAPRLSIVDGAPCFDLVEPIIDLQKFSLPHDKNYPEVDVPLDWPLLMLFTSGTTGTPKGVMLHGQMLEVNQLQTIENWGLKQTDCTLVETPFFHTGGYNVLCLPLLKLGGKVILAQGFAVENVFHSFAEEAVSVYFGVPTMFQMLAESPLFDSANFSSLRFFVSGGAAISIELIGMYQKKGLMFKQGFGLTEVGPNCFLLHEKDALRKAGSIGRPMPHSEVLVVDEKGQPLGPHQSGELLIKGPHVCLGYFKQPTRFADSLLDGYFRTGDLMEYDEEGFFFVTGRIKDMYISGGENVFPGEVEQKLKMLEGVRDAVVVAVPDEKWGEVGHAFLRTSKNYTVAILRELLTPLLSRYKHPHHLTVLESFPQLANGKTDRAALKQQAR